MEYRTERTEKTERTEGQRRASVTLTPTLTLSETKEKGSGEGAETSARSRHSGFIFSIKRSFLCLLKRFSRFSRRIADNESEVISK